MAMTRSFSLGDEIPPLSKTITQTATDLFEKSGGATGPSQFTDEATTRGVLGASGTVASGRMSLTFAMEALRRYFGSKVYNRVGMVELRFLRPVRPGDLCRQSDRSQQGDERRSRCRGCHRYQPDGRYHRGWRGRMHRAQLVGAGGGVTASQPLQIRKPYNPGA